MRRRISSFGSSTLRVFSKCLRLVVPQPEDFRGGEAGQRRVGDQLDQVRTAAGAALDFLALGGGPLIVPEDGAANDLVVLVEKHRAVHLAREPDRLDVGRFELGLGHRLADRADRRLPPIVRVLLAPKRLGEVAGVGLHGRGEDRAPLVDGQGLGARGADVDAEIGAHGGDFPMGGSFPERGRLARPDKGGRDARALGNPVCQVDLLQSPRGRRRFSTSGSGRGDVVGRKPPPSPWVRIATDFNPGGGRRATGGRRGAVTNCGGVPAGQRPTDCLAADGTSAWPPSRRAGGC